MTRPPLLSADLELLSERLALASWARKRGGVSIAVLAVTVHPTSQTGTLETASLNQLSDLAMTRIRGCLRPVDTVAQIGPLEFVVLLERAEEGAFASHVADAIVGSARRPFSTRTGPVALVASVGISVYPDDGERLPDLLACAQAAGQAAQLSGGGLFGFYSGDLNEVAARRMAIERALNEAVAKEQLTLNFQPQIDTRDGTLVGLEALLRWKHPTLGQVPPMEFVPVLEAMGLVEVAGAWVLGEACRQAATLAADGHPVRVGVNVSAHQLHSGDFERHVQRALEQSRLDPRLLELELTESVLLENRAHVRETLDTLRADGVRVALDDFGTGYASLAYIRQFPMDTLKIDRQFVRGLPVDAQNVAIACAINALAQSLQLDVVAEGVETEAEEEFLHSVHCYVVQGFLHARPMSPEALVAWLRAHPWA